MCGIVGRAGLLNADDERIFKTLLLLDYFRGQDSTGIATISKIGRVEVLKMADDPIMLMKHLDFESTVVGSADAIWIGHNRAATVGVTSRANAHPFRCDHITGVHNGTLDRSSFQELSSRLDNVYGTDSETIFQHMAKYGVDETVARLQGAWALVWYDEIDKTLNMLKNDKRPLYTCKSERGALKDKILTWASEYKMIVAARAMADVNDGQLITDEDGFGFFPLPDDTLHTWTKEQLLRGDLEAKTRPLAGMPPRPVVTTAAGFQFTNNTTAKVNNATTFQVVEDVYEDVPVDIEDTTLILGVMEQDEWNEIARFGCSCCGADVDPEEKGLVVYVNEGVVICPKCSNEEDTIVSNAFGVNLTAKMLS